MSFTTDKQTLDDLNIMVKPGADAIFDIYNNTKTQGGAEILKKMFLHPFSEIKPINDRSDIIRYFDSQKLVFPIQTEILDNASIYLKMTDTRTKLSLEDNKGGRQFGKMLFGNSSDQKLIYKGIQAVIEIWNEMHVFIKKIETTAITTPYKKEMEGLLALIKEPSLSPLMKEKANPKMSHEQAVDLDDLLRFKHRDTIQQMLDYIYSLDVYISIAKVASSRNFKFPTALGTASHTVSIEGLYHPLVKNAKSNDVEITPQSNIIFLTGANMAGKSTFMKSLGVALYLAHLGFPVAASKMEFSVRDGMYTAINLPDDLSAGNSHFYAEVLRVKKVAKELGASKNLFIIFDELFRGTNVKDAYEGTIAITQAFASKKNCMFIVSTHIIEAGEVLKERCNNLSFLYLPTEMNKNTPVYTYKLKSGITSDRHGMVIINNEGILDILKKGKKLA